MTEDRLKRLSDTIRARRAADPGSSYVAQLLQGPRERIAQKLGEEAIEAVIAAIRNDPASLKSEAADLVFHLAVLLDSMELSFDDVLIELDRRDGVSGLTEKADRSSVPVAKQGD